MGEFGGYDDRQFIAEYYDLVPGYAARPDVDFYLDLAASTGGKILELGCGTGRVLIPTAAAGLEIVGLDVSEHMLAGCRKALESQPKEVRERVRLVRASMTDFELGDTFSLITTPFRSFQHLLSVDDQMACLRCAHRHLAKGGKFVLELFQVDPARMYDPAFAEESEDFADVELPDGGKLRRTHRVAAFHRAQQYNDVEMIYYVTRPDGRTERLVWAFPFRYFFPFEVEHLLARCGFKVAELYGDFDKSSLTDDSPEMIFVAHICSDSSGA